MPTFGARFCTYVGGCEIVFSGPDFVLTLAGVRLCRLSGPDFVLTLAGVRVWVSETRFYTYVGWCEMPAGESEWSLSHCSATFGNEVSGHFNRQ